MSSKGWSVLSLCVLLAINDSLHSISFMKEATQGYRGGIDVLPVVGMFCCAKFTDETWYRAKVVDVVTQGTLLF